ncbi:ferredoxin [Streptomyces sp. NPDC001663]|uniref:ferredoxin n=1 Tax=Streptomyces sp. NPDC001663 TaxID=3364597 RepID=UPI0036B10453
MRVRVDPAACRGYAVCHEVAPDHYAMDDWGLAQSVGKDVAPEEVSDVERSIRVCPYRAIRWIGDADDTP